MGPLTDIGVLNSNWELLIALIIGIGFGFLLEAAGFTNTRKLAGIFYGHDATVIKVFFSAAMTAAVGLLIIHYFGWIDVTLTFYPKTFWISTLIGGAIMGAGFVIGGFCPGTSLCAAVTGKIDAMVFIGGVFIGIFGFIFSFDLIFAELRNAGAMGKVNIAELLGLDDGIFIFIMIIITFVTFYIFQKWQNSQTKKMEQSDLDELGLNKPE